MVCAFDGSIEAGYEVGGIVSNSSGDDKIENCHVTADVFAKEILGGIVGTSDRSMVVNCYVEGALELDENAEIVKVGGVIGVMGSTLSDSVYALVANNIVALEKIELPEVTMELYAHRIVGYSNGDSFEYDWDNRDPSKPKEEWPRIYNEAEKCLKYNYVVSDLAAIDVAVELTDTTTEGATLDRSLMTVEWLLERGFMKSEI